MLLMMSLLSRRALCHSVQIGTGRDTLSSAENASYMQMINRRLTPCGLLRRVRSMRSFCYISTDELSWQRISSITIVLYSSLKTSNMSSTQELIIAIINPKQDKFDEVNAQQWICPVTNPNLVLGVFIVGWPHQRCKRYRTWLRVVSSPSWSKSRKWRWKALPVSITVLCDNGSNILWPLENISKNKIGAP